MITIGTRKWENPQPPNTGQREVSELNAELYAMAIKIMDDDDQHEYKDAHHMGKVELGRLIDALEERYNITPK